MSRRLFLGVFAYPAAAVALGFPAPTFARSAREIADELASHRASPDEAAADEAFWAQVGRAFTVDRSLINLNNGGVSPSPGFVQEAMKRHLDYSNSCPPPYALWKVLEPQKEGVRERLAKQWGVDAEEIAITRNSSESLQICQLGFDLKAGDEVLCCTQDYPRMRTTFKQRARRDGIVIKEVQVPVPAEDGAAILDIYRKAITPKTRLMLISHMVNITGQIMPVREIVSMARQQKVPVIVDGAHALAHFDFKLSDLDCDYYGVSLHKWLFAPHGTGLLYVRRDKIKGLWPMQAADEKLDTDIRKFEEIGTHPAANFLAIGEALTFNQGIGLARKEARLRYLRDWWAKRLLQNKDRVKLHTSLNPEFSCGIGTVQVLGIDVEKLAGWLWDHHRILTVGIRHAEFEGIRITPSVYTTLEELDRFCSAVEHAIKDGLPV